MLDTSKLFDAAGGNKYKPNEEDIIERFTDDDRMDFPIELTDLDLWANYMDDDLYVMDVKLREFLKKTRYAREKKGYFRTTCSVVFAWIYGRKPEPRDSATCRVLHELLKYYCTEFVDNTTYKGKKVSRVYEFSTYATENKRPYSLRLRLELHDGETDVWHKTRSGNPEAKRRHGRRKH